MSATGSDAQPIDSSRRVSRRSSGRSVDSISAWKESLFIVVGPLSSTRRELESAVFVTAHLGTVWVVWKLAETQLRLTVEWLVTLDRTHRALAQTPRQVIRRQVLAR